MSDSDELPAGGVDVLVDGAVGNDVIEQLRGQIQELRDRREDALANSAVGGGNSTRSYIYVPRERQVQPFCGEYNKDGRSVEEFIEEVERVLRARDQTREEQLDFIISLLRGPALEEVRLCVGNQSRQASDLFTFLQEAFGERRSGTQLLQMFYNRKQLEGEDLRNYSHALSRLLSSVTKQSLGGLANEQGILRDQFVEGVRDAALRRELRKTIREKPHLTLLEIRNEAILWSMEESRPTRVANSRPVHSEVLSETKGNAAGSETQTSTVLNDILQVITRQDKRISEQEQTISELTKAVKELTVQRSVSVPQNFVPLSKSPPRFTEEGEPICFRCNEVGHIARRCTMRRGGRPKSAARTDERQENQGPSMALSQATQGVVSGSPPEGTSRDRFLERAVGTCPMVDLKVRGVQVSCLLDTGSQVSTITEAFFREYLFGNESDVLSTSGWLKITAANGLDIPYLGYMELDVEVMGMTLPECGFLIVKETPSPSSMAVLIGMNIISKCRQIVHAEFDTTLGGRLDSNWRVAFQQAQSVELVERVAFARVAGKTPAHVPAWSAATVLIKGMESGEKKEGSAWLVEPVNAPLPGGLIVVPTLVTSELPVCPVRVLNLSQEDLWLQPRARLGMLSRIDGSNAGSSCEVKFQRISADTERVTVGVGQSSETPVQSVLDQVDMGGTPEQQVQLKAVLEKYLGVFALDDDDLGYTDKVQHEIHLTDDVPVNQPYRRVPPNQYQEVREHITKLLKKGVVQESVSAYASPVVLVRKTDGSLRLCVDYRKLNAKTRRDAFPLPRIDESFDALGGAKFFSTVDLASGYHQIAVSDKDRAKTAFTTPFGLFEYRRMPFGVCNGPSTFQRLMQAVMSDLIFQVLIVYLDDILLFSKTFEEHLERLEMVLKRLAETGLKVKLGKCCFLQDSVRFLGHQVSVQGISPDPGKVAAVSNWKIPETVKELRSFLGFCSYYRKFIEGFSKIAGPLHDLVNVCLREGRCAKSGRHFSTLWSDECDRAFNQLKETLTTAPVLGFADFSCPFILETDASQNGLGAILYQKQGDEKRVIAYASRRLRNAEKNDRNYSSMKLELLALKWAVVEKFRGYLLGSWFEVITDNNPLCHLQTAKLGAIEQRWVAQLSVFNFEVKYRPGKSNAAADALSRQEFAGEPESDPDADWNECVAICSVISQGNSLGTCTRIEGC